MTRICFGRAISLATRPVWRYATTPMSQRSQEDDLRLVERLTNDEYKLVDGVLASEVLSKDWSQTWARLANDRMKLAEAHLAAAEALADVCASKGWDSLGRSVINRAYYAMFCAVRAALAFEHKADHNDHKKLPDVLAKTTTLGPTDDRIAASSHLAKGRDLRNKADYSAYCPQPVGYNAGLVLSQARDVVMLCQRWVEQIKKERKL